MLCRIPPCGVVCRLYPSSCHLSGIPCCDFLLKVCILLGTSIIRQTRE
jgi:hypothetical protein